MLDFDRFFEELKECANGKVPQTDLYRTILAFPLTVLVPVDPLTQLAYPQEREDGTRFMPLFPDQVTFDCYQADHPSVKFEVVRMKAAELVDWAGKLRLGLAVHVYLEGIHPRQVLIPAPDVLALAEGRLPGDSPASSR